MIRYWHRLYPGSFLPSTRTSLLDISLFSRLSKVLRVAVDDCIPHLNNQSSRKKLVEYSRSSTNIQTVLRGLALLAREAGWVESFKCARVFPPDIISGIYYDSEKSDTDDQIDDLDTVQIPHTNIEPKFIEVENFESIDVSLRAPNEK